MLITGASIFGFLGAIHLFYTFFTEKFSPRDPMAADAMKGTSPLLTRDTTVWKAWIGFNASHSLGAMLLAAIYIPLAHSHFSVVQNSLWLSLVPVLAAISYTLLAFRYWFKIPLIGSAAALTCFVLSAWPSLL
ncbi:MAG: hypothetical protein Q8J78_08440 [Moraxellaceae bacterium]|nr:hypothetical protein [Moraxellaceae bacterium]